jgi:hypothetical protein
VRQRGRPSAAAKAIAVVVAGGFGKRPEPPAELTSRQAEIWREVVASEHAEFFSTATTRIILADYCRHREAAENVSSILNSFKPEWLKVEEGARRYALLLRMRELETRASVAMARSLRLTNQSRYQPETASTASRNAIKGARPWEA